MDREGMVPSVDPFGIRRGGPWSSGSALDPCPSLLGRARAHSSPPRPLALPALDALRSGGAVRGGLCCAGIGGAGRPGGVGWPLDSAGVVFRLSFGSPDRIVGPIRSAIPCRVDQLLGAGPVRAGEFVLAIGRSPFSERDAGSSARARIGGWIR